MNHEENEDTVAAFCSRHPDFHPESFSLPGADAPSGMLTCYPHRMRGEGHFVALLRRDGDGTAVLPGDKSLPAPDRNELSVYRDFVGRSAPQPNCKLGDTLCCLPDCPDVKGLRVLRFGLHLGSVRGKLFQPDHAWALCCDRPDFPLLSITPEQAAAYQHGDTVPVPDDVRGWVLPSLGGLVLGWGKASGGVMKNHYPKGLRR